MTIVRPFLVIPMSMLTTCIGLHHRIRETEKCPCEIRPRAHADHDQGNEAGWRDQATERTCVLEKPVRLSTLGTLDLNSSHIFPPLKDGTQPGKTTCPPQKDHGRHQNVFSQACRTYVCRITRIFKGPTEDQGYDKNIQCSDPRGGTVDDYGYRLIHLSTLLFPHLGRLYVLYIHILH